jgi:hypothetical protein
MISSTPYCPLCQSMNVEHSLLGARTYCLDCGKYTCDIHLSDRCPKGVCGWMVETPANTMREQHGRE